MVSLNDYINFGEGFGIASANDVEQLNKALTTGAYGQAAGIAGQTGGAGTYTYYVTAVNRHGESLPCETSVDVVLAKDELKDDTAKGVKLTITK